MSDAITQYTSATNNVVLFDLSKRAQLELQGSDRQAFLHSFCTNDIKRLSPGEGCEAFVTSIKGRILGHILVSATEDALWIDSVPGANEFLTGHLDKYIITEDVQILDRTNDHEQYCLIGLDAASWLREHEGDVAGLPLWGQRPGRLDGLDVLVRRVGFTTAPGYEIVVKRDDREALQELVAVTGVIRGSAPVFEALRIEAGFPHYGIDVTDENIAQEAGRTEQAISFTKGCYLGQEPIARLDALGHTNKELRVLKLSDGQVPERGAPVQSTAGNDVGQITSAALSPGTSHSVALAMLKTSVAQPGADVHINGTPARIE